jgi:hypothetical protein
MLFSYLCNIQVASPTETSKRKDTGHASASSTQLTDLQGCVGVLARAQSERLHEEAHRSKLKRRESHIHCQD